MAIMKFSGLAFTIFAALAAAGPAFAQQCDQLICQGETPPPLLSAADVGVGKTFSNIESALKRMKDDGVITVHAQPDNAGFFFIGPLPIAKDVTLVGAPTRRGERVLLMTNGQCFAVDPGVTLRLRNIEILAQGRGADGCLVAGEGARIDLDHVKIVVAGYQTGDLVELGRFATLSAPASAEGLLEFYGGLAPDQAAIRSAASATVALRQPAEVRFVHYGISANGPLSGETVGLDIDAEITPVRLENGDAAVAPLRLKGGVLRAPPARHFVEIVNGGALALAGVGIQDGVISVASDSRVNLTIASDPATRAINDVSGALVIGDNVSGSVSVEKTRFSTRRDEKGVADYPTFITVGAGFKGMLAMEDVIFDGPDIGISIASASAADAIDIENLVLAGEGKIGVQITSTDVVAEAVKGIEIDDLSRNPAFRAPLVFPGEHSICKTARDRDARRRQDEMIALKIQIGSYVGSSPASVRRKICS